MSLRVVHVVRQFLPSRGGMEDVVFNIARMQQELHGQRPSVVTLDRVFRQSEVLPSDEVMDGIPVHRLPYSGSERYPLFPAVLKNLGEADVVHVHGIDFAFDYLSLTRWWHRKPMVACTHGGFFHTSFAQRAKKMFFHSVTRCTARGYHRILASSANDGAMFRQVVPDDRVRVIENGVDIDKFAGASSPTLRPTHPRGRSTSAPPPRSSAPTPPQSDTSLYNSEATPPPGLSTTSSSRHEGDGPTSMTSCPAPT